MANRKEQYLESARKWIVKGQLDRAIKDYEQVVALDPVDMKQRQKLAELLVRAGKNAPAVKEYEVIGKYYAENGYYLKAIAVYKQIQKLDPEDVSVTLKLGEYNVKQGLVGNAIAEYNMALRHHQQRGDTKEALKVLDRMAEADPENPDIVLKKAEARVSAGFTDDAYDDFSRLALLLLRRGDGKPFDDVCGRILSLYPQRSDFLLKVLEAQVESGHPGLAIPRLQEIIKSENRNLPVWHLLLKAYRNAGQTSTYISALKHMLKFFSGDLFPREHLITIHIEIGDSGKAIGYFQDFLDDFLVKKEYEKAEHLCNSLRSLSTDDVQLLPLLTRIYEASGNAEKLSELTARIAPKVADETGVEPPECVSEPATQVVGETGGRDVVASACEFQEAEDDSWEDELDLSLVEELAGTLTTASLPGAEEAGGKFGGGKQSEAPLPPASDNDGQLLTDWGSPFGLYPGQDAGAETFGSFSGVFGDGSGESLFSEDELPDFDEFSTALDDLFGEGLKDPSLLSQAELPDETKAVADEQADESDSETHYDLGIAYMEMGLMDEAINELRKAGISPRRSFDCLNLEGICLREKGDYEGAEALLKRILAIPGASTEQTTSAKYDLALLYEITGRNEDAEGLYSEIHATMPDFRDVAARLGQHGDETLVDLEVVE